MDKVQMDIVVKKDGVFLIVDNQSGQPVKISRMDVLNLVEAYKVADVDYVTLNESLKNEIDHLELKISNNTQISEMTETVSIEVNREKMEAYVNFTAPLSGKSKSLTTDEILAAVQKAGIVNIDLNILKDLAANKQHNRQYVVAEGVAPVNGVDGSLEYHFDNSNLQPKPKIMEDGTVNFRELG